MAGRDQTARLTVPNLFVITCVSLRQLDFLFISISSFLLFACPTLWPFDELRVTSRFFLQVLGDSGAKGRGEFRAEKGENREEF